MRKIIHRPPTQEYADNYERIFRNKREIPELSGDSTLPTNITTRQEWISEELHHEGE